MSQSLLVATRKGLFRFARDTGSWRSVAVDFLGDPVTMVLYDGRDQSTYAALNLGHFGVKLRRRSEGGDWEEAGLPTFPPRPDDWKEDDAKPGSKAKWSTQLIWALETANLAPEGDLWAGTIPGGLFHSTDRGAEWTLIRSLWDRSERLEWFGGGYDDAGIHSICVNPRDPRRLTVGVSCGGVWKSSDGGETWELHGDGLLARYMPPGQQAKLSIQDAHRLVQCRESPDDMWIQHHNGIFRSRDAGVTWSEIESAGPSTFGFAVAVHPSNPEVAWFAPAQKDECRTPVNAEFVVTRTRDGGASFEVLTQGLPQPPAYDIVFRHALDVDSSGNCVALGSTTGGLWITEDQGDHWEEISAHLPPVYCVRFVDS